MDWSMVDELINDTIDALIDWWINLSIDSFYRLIDSSIVIVIVMIVRIAFQTILFLMLKSLRKLNVPRRIKNNNNHNNNYMYRNSFFGAPT